MAVIGAWLPSCSRAADEPASIEQRIDQEVHQINSQLAKGRAFALEPHYEFEWYVFVTVFEDTNGHIRKIIDWAEGAREGNVAGIPPGPFTLRSILEWYYDTEGEPIFLVGRYEGEPGSGMMQENIYYIKNVKKIESREADSYIRPYFYQSETNKDLVSSGHDKLQSVSRMLSEQGHRKSAP
jgi:hypothetical protein